MSPIRVTVEGNHVTLIHIVLSEEGGNYYGLVVNGSGKIEEVLLEKIKVSNPQTLFNEAKG